MYGTRWTKLKVTVTNKKAIIYVNDVKAYAWISSMMPLTLWVYNTGSKAPVQ